MWFKDVGIPDVFNNTFYAFNCLWKMGAEKPIIRLELGWNVCLNLNKSL